MKNKLTSILLLTFILFQGCTVYHKTSVSIEEAVNKGKTKVVYDSGTVHILDNIVLKDSTYYGMMGKNITPFQPDENFKVYRKNKAKSIIIPIVSGLGVIAIYVYIGISSISF